MAIEESALNGPTEQLAALIHHAPLGVFLVDADFRIVLINAEAQPAFADIPDPIGRDFAEVARSVWDEEYADEVVARFRHTRETGEPYRAPERAPLQADRPEARYYEWRIDRITFSEGRHGVACYLRDITERKKSESALAQVTAESEQQRRLYQTIISSTPDLVYVFDLAYRFVFVNEALLEMWGRSLEDSIGKTLLEVGYEPWHAEMHEREIDQVVATKQPIRGEVGFRHATLGPRVYDYIFVPVLNGAGEVESVAGTTRDVTDHRKHEKERERLLREVEAEQERLARLFEHAPSFMAVLRGPDHVFARANANYFRLVGHRDILGKPMREAFPEADGQRFVERLERVYQTGEPYRETDVRMELEDPSRPGHTDERWLDLVCQPIRDADGSLTGILVQGVDLTERKRAELAKRESEERFRNLADNIAQFAWMADSEGSIYWYNRRWFEYTGTTLEAMRGWGWTAVHHPDHVDAVVEKFTACVREGRSWEDTFPLRSKDGEYRWFLSRAIPLRDESGDVVRWFGTNTDITEQVALEAALKETDRRKDEFLATLAHELRNPLAPIRMAADLLGVVKEDPSRLGEVADVIARQTANMTRLIDDLLDISRITRGKIDLRTERVDLASLISENAEVFRAECEAEDVELALQLPGEPLPIHGDPVRVVQILNNLLSNALKFTGPGGRIGIAAAKEDPHVSIRVSDTGIGIEAEHLDRIFEMFAQVASPGCTAQAGLGIGLSLTRSLVEVHGGTVTAESEGPGKGSEFEVRLPLAPVAEVEATKERGPSRDRERTHEIDAPAASRTVLAVDDNRDALTAVATLLRTSGHAVETADNGTDALEKARIHRPEVILLDIGMPGLDGYEIARRIRRRPWGRNVLLVAMTGWGQEKDKREALEAGFDVHLTKPADADAIRKLLSDLPR